MNSPTFDPIYSTAVQAPQPARQNKFTTLTTSQLASQNRQRNWLVEGAFLHRQPAVIGGPAKCFKTSLAVDLAVSLATGTPFLGRFNVPSTQRVLFMSGETMGDTLLARARSVAVAKGIDLAQYDPQIVWVERVPQLDNPADLDEMWNMLSAMKFAVAIIDPLYYCLPRLSSQVSNLYTMGALLSQFAGTCLAAGTTPIFVHHVSKSAAEKRAGCAPTVSDLSQSGISEFARSWALVNHDPTVSDGAGQHHLLMRLGGSAGYESQWNLSIDVGELQTDFRGGKWEVRILPRDNSEPAPRRRRGLTLENPFE